MTVTLMLNASPVFRYVGVNAGVISGGFVSSLDGGPAMIMSDGNVSNGVAKNKHTMNKLNLPDMTTPSDDAGAKLFH
jgi:hypothetical protein